MQMKNSLHQVNNLIEECFTKCVATGWGGSIKSKRLTDSESTCISACAEKHMKLIARCGHRFAEAQNEEALKNGEAHS
jgi:hypothetical protein